MSKTLIKSKGFRVNTKSLGRVDVVGYQQYPSGSLVPILKVSERIGNQPIYGRLKGEIDHFEPIYEVNYFEWDLGFNLFRRVTLSEDQLSQASATAPDSVDCITSVLLSDLGDAKKVWSVLRTLVNTSNLEKCWTIIHLFGGGYCVRDRRTNELFNGAKILSWVNPKA